MPNNACTISQSLVRHRFIYLIFSSSVTVKVMIKVRVRVLGLGLVVGLGLGLIIPTCRANVVL